jgi:YidC/Oxa1 family membrane protein insertase
MDKLQWRATAALVLSLLVLLFWDRFFGVPTPPPPVPVQQAQTTPAKPEALPPAPAPRTAAQAQAPTPAQAHAPRDVVVTTDLYRAVFSEQGARLKSFQLNKFRETVNHDSPPMELVRTKDPAQWPLGVKLLQPALNTGSAVFTADQTSLDLRARCPEVGAINFELTTPDGLKVIKRFEFRQGLYRIDMQVAVQNHTAAGIESEPSLALTSLPFSDNNGHYHEAAVMAGSDVEKVEAKKLTEPRLIRGDVRWAAYNEPFFVAAVAPAPGQAANVRLAAQGPLVDASLISPPQPVPAGQQRTYNYSIYYGPKEMKILAAQGLGLESLINYGWFDIIAKPLMWVLIWIDGFVRNWGVAIIVLTVLIKIAFWPLAHKSYRSMREMQKLQPKLARLKEKYKGDTAKINQETLNLYRTYKVNPMGGCLPMLAQIPVFFALYRVLQYSVELRHAPFVLWINDLSAPDRLNIGIPIPHLGGLPVLTLLMGASMWLQQKMTPVTGDPSQAKMMQLLPVVFTFMFIYFPSGLVLYWLVNNVLSIGQQYYVNRSLA